MLPTCAHSGSMTHRFLVITFRSWRTLHAEPAFKLHQFNGFVTSPLNQSLPNHLLPARRHGGFARVKAPRVQHCPQVNVAPHRLRAADKLSEAGLPARKFSRTSAGVFPLTRRFDDIEAAGQRMRHGRVLHGWNCTLSSWAPGFRARSMRCRRSSSAGSARSVLLITIRSASSTCTTWAQKTLA